MSCNCIVVVAVMVQGCGEKFVGKGFISSDTVSNKKFEESDQPTGTQEGLERGFGALKLVSVLHNISWCKKSVNITLRLLYFWLSIFEYI